ncbi:MAG: S9 family peptidase, partial [Chlamydiae bacterium]|nr:S9 family peptidase [Chlamydiota bacterium]
MPSIAPYGLWTSPLSSKEASAGALRFGQLDTCTNCFYFTESRPSEKGRCALMKGGLFSLEEVLPSTFSVRTRVHEYGGKCFAGSHDTVYFVNYSDQTIYQKKEGASPTLLLQQPKTYYADLFLTKTYLYAVAEDHSQGSIQTSLVRIDLKTGHVITLAYGCDFYAAPRVNDKETQIAFLTWNFPYMPWDSTRLWVADLTQEGLSSPLCIAGGNKESITHPLWHQETLYFTSDRTGFWNIYLHKQNTPLEALHPTSIDFGAAHWIFGSERLATTQDDHLLAIGTENGVDALYRFHLITRKMTKLETPFTSLSDLYFFQGHALFFASAADLPTSLVAWDLKKSTYTFLKNSQKHTLPSTCLSYPQRITFPTKDNQMAYGLYYPPQNSDYQPLKNSLPPLILKCHGGPTHHAAIKYNPDILFFTSRGFAFFEINYRGSTGFGKAYRDLLKLQWGIADRDDCLYAVDYLIKNRLADPDHLFLKGSSSGGYSVFSVLIHSPAFQGAVSYYGISDLEDLVKNSHKLEKH